MKKVKLQILMLKLFKKHAVRRGTLVHHADHLALWYISEGFKNE